MDDFVKYLIWIFIIVSFLSSFFKKKKQPQAPAPPRNYGDMDSPPVKEQSANTLNKEDYDILKEIETMFKPGTSQPTTIEKAQGRQETSRTESEHVIYEKGKNPLDAYKIDTTRRQSDTEMTASEHVLEDWSKKQEVKRKSDKLTVSRQAEAFEKYLRKRDAEKINFASIIDKRLKQPSSLKEYLIISAILDKPKALRNVRRYN